MARPASTNLDLTAHLVLTFFSHVHNQFIRFLRKSAVLDSIYTESISTTLVHAMCAASVRYSTAQAVREAGAKRMADDFAVKAREGIYRTDGKTMQGLLTLCVLITYELGEGDGRQGWCDIGEVHV